jgi:hypothetical protein
MIVTGIPNFDHFASITGDTFPHSGYVLVATSNSRETFKMENRRQFLEEVLRIAAGRPLIFKLHPNENIDRATNEIREVVGEVPIYANGDIAPMIVNCEVLITQYSSVAFHGLAIGKEVHSYFDVDELRRLLPRQNGGTSSARIAAIGETLLRVPQSEVKQRAAAVLVENLFQLVQFPEPV